MDVIRTAIRQPVTVAVGVILVLLAGLIALTRLPISLTPTVQNTVVSVNTFWEGASPEEIEQNIIDKQEERLLGLSSLRLMTSESQQGFGRIRLEFFTGTDIDAALADVSRQLDQVPEYPENVDEPIIEESDFENRDYIAWIVFGTSDPGLDIRTLRDFAVDRIEPALERVPGIAEINVLGGRERELQVRVDAHLLARHGITPTDFARVVQDTNRNVSAGQLAEGKLDVRVRTIGQYETVEEVGDTVIAHTDAGRVLLRDVADAAMTYKEPTSFVRSRGVPVIAINAQREIDSNVMAVMADLRKAIDELNAPGGLLEAEALRLGLDGDLTLTQVYDQTVYIEDAIDLVRTNIWIGGALAVVVLLAFLRSVRTVGIIALAIPISIVGAVVAMVGLGRSINVISLAGMAFAVGMVVDNAIVVLENIFRHLEMGKRPMEAAYDGAREVWGAVLASTLTTVAVFIPILLVQEESGQLFRDIALAICAAVTLSLLVSITVIPTAAARVLRAKRRRAEPAAGAARPASRARLARIRAAVGRPADAIAGLVYWLCGSLWSRLAVIALLTVASVAGTLLLMPPADYLPAGNRNLVFGLVIAPPGYNLDQASEMGSRIEETIAPFYEAGKLRGDPEAYRAAVAALPEVPSFDWRTGQVSMVTPPPIDNYFLVWREGILFHGAVSDEPSRVADLLPLFAHATRPEVLPGVIAFPLQVPLFQVGGSTGSAVKLQLAGPDLEEVIACAQPLYLDLADRYGFGAIQPVPGNFSIPGPELQIVPDLVRLSELGLTTRDIGLAVQSSGDGAIVDEFKIGGETIDLKVINAEVVDQQSIPDLRDLPLATPSGHVVTLGAIADVVRTSRPEVIARVGRQRSVSFEVTAPRGKPLEEMIDEIEGMLADARSEGRLPPSIATSLAGTASRLDSVQSALLGDGTVLGTLGSSLVLALIVVYLLLCVLFQSFLSPLVIMVSVPLATLGGFAALAAVHLWSLADPYMPVQNLDVLTMLGFIILIGVVVNNAILLVHQTNNFREGRGDVGPQAADEPMTPRRAIAEAVRTRVRPIFMSMLTSVGGMLPLVLMPGSGSELYRGLGSVVVGGLVVSTVFTLLLVPLLLSLVLDAQALLRPRPTPAMAG